MAVSLALQLCPSHKTTFWKDDPMQVIRKSFCTLLFAVAVAGGVFVPHPPLAVRPGSN